MFQLVSARGKWTDRSHNLKLRIKFGILFPLGVEEWWQICLQSSFICSPKKLMGERAKPAKLVGVVEGEGGTD